MNEYAEMMSMMYDALILDCTIEVQKRKPDPNGTWETPSQFRLGLHKLAGQLWQLETMTDFQLAVLKDFHMHSLYSLIILICTKS